MCKTVKLIHDEFYLLFVSTKNQVHVVQFVHAKKAVVSNASMWDTLSLLPKEVIPKSYEDRIKATPQCESFMHLHLGFDAEVCPSNFYFLLENILFCSVLPNSWTPRAGPETYRALYEN